MSGFLLQHLDHGVEDREALRPDLVLVELEVDLLGDLHFAVGDDHERGLRRAAERFLRRRADLVRALILHVEDRVLVVVGIGAAVCVLEAVRILRLERALVRARRGARRGRCRSRGSRPRRGSCPCPPARARTESTESTQAVAVGVRVSAATIGSFAASTKPRSAQYCGGDRSSAACAFGSAFHRCFCAFDTKPWSSSRVAKLQVRARHGELTRRAAHARRCAPPARRSSRGPRSVRAASAPSAQPRTTAGRSDDPARPSVALASSTGPAVRVARELNRLVGVFFRRCSARSIASP